ncbi:MAG TPA: hypothetical protein VM577_15455 [Anaerovoracaceae bacterium]|nr:hypothetical protein [Anaerovoracaceae bacterium]
MGCPVCYHDNYSNPPLDDLEAACDCDCHNGSFDDDGEDEF